MLKKETELKTARLVMKPYEERDKDAMVDILCNEEIKKTFMIPDFETRLEAEKLFYKLMEFSRSDGHFEYGIYLNGKLIGFLNDCDIEGGEIEVGYVIHPDFKGKGYATEALAAAIEELFRMGYHRVTAGFFEENTPSRRVMEKCGMTKIDLEEDEEYRGKIHHCLYYGIEK